MVEVRWNYIWFSLIVLIGSIGCKNMNRESKIKVLMHGCYSTDPLLYDSYCHHILIRSVVAPLVSNYGRSGISEGLASSWVENLSLIHI